MKLAAIDIGTNSIHMIVVKVLQRRTFEIIDREKEMVKLGAGVFSSNRLSDRAFNTGLETIHRCVQLADKLGVDDIITAATSAIREAQNGEAFLNEVVRRTRITPRMISGKEEARLIFLAVRNAIALEDRNALVFDIGGGSTEAVVGHREAILFGTSMKLGVQRLLDMFEDQGSIGEEARGVLEAHIRFLAKQPLQRAKQIGFSQVIGTSGTIRTLGEAAYTLKHQQSLRSVNAEVVQVKDLQVLTDRLVDLKPGKRAEISGISDKRTDAIHLGGILLVQLLQMAEVKELTLSDASLREGMILDYLEQRSQDVADFPIQVDLRHRNAAQLVHKYDANWDSNCHIAHLALTLFEQTQQLHHYGDLERDVLEYAALLHDIGQYLSFRGYHKNSRYILGHADPRGFTDEEILLIGHVIRYHRKAYPQTKHKKFKRLSEADQQVIWILAGLLRVAVGLDRTKNQLVETLSCQVFDQTLEIMISGTGSLELELWAAQEDCGVLARALELDVSIQVAT
ncbi:Ppx/GppA phosphatase family protein [Acaryochloris sp. CCMEE 5410]|uniref:Ppx/GppA phosphatase family protein n=1 Tax=Acaryochloris sp. CCMEE 5410 TaxID=310037 RepID=UPI0002484EDA|nr:Ppx/GppA phosphatase family protein [Acaryochloris sp. CCMEE 5410]KAI9132305.1 Ppx/GppA family phosphatase [Acaryochloris sp. CCMEE 5410]